MVFKLQIFLGCRPIHIVFVPMMEVISCIHYCVCFKHWWSCWRDCTLEKHSHRFVHGELKAWFSQMLSVKNWEIFSLLLFFIIRPIRNHLWLLSLTLLPHSCQSSYTKHRWEDFKRLLSCFYPSFLLLKPRLRVQSPTFMRNLCKDNKKEREWQKNLFRIQDMIEIFQKLIWKKKYISSAENNRAKQCNQLRSTYVYFLSVSIGLLFCFQTLFDCDPLFWQCMLGLKFLLAKSVLDEFSLDKLSTGTFMENQSFLIWVLPFG